MNSPPASMFLSRSRLPPPGNADALFAREENARARVMLSRVVPASIRSYGSLPRRNALKSWDGRLRLFCRGASEEGRRGVLSRALI
mmetsp:Transcript_61503/g.181757  ORF Transcript_61503/g.181757 Transcript_61503/m.181757 type:complete len:86 (+) Transcript_61503:424-681(+)